MTNYYEFHIRLIYSKIQRLTKILELFFREYIMYVFSMEYFEISLALYNEIRFEFYQYDNDSYVSLLC